MNENWINFKDLRSHLTFEKVLHFYGVAGVTMKGKQLVGRCPLPTHNPDKKSPTFSAHPEKGIFQCFSCGGKGNLLDFCVLMDGGNPERGLDVRKTALKLHKEFVRSGSLHEAPKANGKPEAPARKPIYNEPLLIRLKDLNPEHPYLRERKFERATLDQFGVGYCSHGMFAHRIAIPLHDQKGQLIGYAGRTVADAEPKYLFPGPRERDGELHEFKKTFFIYNGHRIANPVDDLIIVEGFPSVWWLTQHGLPNCVAIMGDFCSAEQLELIIGAINPHGRAWIMTDGDKAGIKCGCDLAGMLARSRLCRVVIETGAQPTDFTGEKLRALLVGNRSIGAETLKLAPA